MREQALSKPQIITALTKSPHGDLVQYIPIANAAIASDPDFYAHLTAWNQNHGQVRDARVALPILGLSGWTASFGVIFQSRVYIENALACLAALDPRSLDRALQFAKDLHAPQRLLRRLVERYLRNLERDPGHFSRVALQHRQTVQGLYARHHLDANPGGPPGDGLVNRTLFREVAGGRFAALRGLKDLAPDAIAGAMRQYRLPFLIVRRALGTKATEPAVALALIQAMSPTELVTNTRALKRLGVTTVPALRAAYEEALEKAGGKAAVKKGAVLKTTRAADVLETSGETTLAGKLRGLQERQLAQLGGIEGDWAVFGDKSGSMRESIAGARQIAATLARLVKGTVHLVFFDTAPRYVDATGQSYEMLTTATAQIGAGGGTSIGCALQYLLDKQLAVDGIAIVSDGGENHTPYFVSIYPKYAKALDREPTIYFYQTNGSEGDNFSAQCRKAEIDVQHFDIRQSADYYSLPNLVETMRVRRYALVDEILATPLKRLDEVLTRTVGMEVNLYGPARSAPVV